MDPKKKQALWVAVGIALLGIAETLKQNAVVPAQYAWALDGVILLAGMLKGGALITKPGDSKPGGEPQGVGSLPPPDPRDVPTKPDRPRAKG